MTSGPPAVELKGGVPVAGEVWARRVEVREIANKNKTAASVEWRTDRFIDFLPFLEFVECVDVEAGVWCDGFGLELKKEIVL